MGDDSRWLKVPVWDVPTRLFHWLLVALIGFSWWSAEQGGLWLDYHMWSGYAVLTLVLFRILWGFAGSTHARFGDFVRGPRTILAHVATLHRRRGAIHDGHNPLGGWMVLGLLAVVLFQATTGLFANDDIFTQGPLASTVSKSTSDWLTRLHKQNFDLILILAAVHVAAAVFYLLYKRENLIGAMITGRKTLPPGVAGRPRTTASLWLAVVLLGLCAGAVYWLVA